MGLMSAGSGTFGIPYKEIAFIGSMSDWNGTSQIIVKKDGSADTTSRRTGGSGSGTYITTGDFLQIEATSSRLSIRSTKAGRFVVGSGSMENGIHLSEKTVTANALLGSTTGNGGCVFVAAL